MGISFNRKWGVSEFHSRTVRGKNENLYASVRVVIAVKVVPSEKRFTLVGCLNSLTGIATLPRTTLPNRFKRASFLRSERVLHARVYHVEFDRCRSNSMSTNVDPPEIWAPRILPFKVNSTKCIASDTD